MALQTIMNSRPAVNIVLFLARIIPPWIGYPLAETIARVIASLKNSRMVKAVRSNQWVVSGQELNSQELDQLTFATFRHTADCLYDLYHYLPYPKHILRMVKLSDRLEEAITDQAKAKRGLIIMGIHLSNFDLAGRVMALHGFKILVLSYPKPTGGYQEQNRLRKNFGMEITPMSLESLRIAKERLRKGEVILSGLDRPLETSHYYEDFFGFKAAMPATYVRLGIMTNSPVLVVACLSNGRGSYSVDCSNLIEMIPYKDAEKEIVENVGKVLRETEKFIRKAPYQWSMFYPVWPWALGKMP